MKFDFSTKFDFWKKIVISLSFEKKICFDTLSTQGKESWSLGDVYNTQETE